MTMLLVLMLTSKGIAGVPRASLVVVAATCGMFDILGDCFDITNRSFCDMFRSATNVLGNALASVVGQWEENNEIDIVP
jgi:Na+/H+-dicarboxylate symporter